MSEIPGTVRVYVPKIDPRNVKLLLCCCITPRTHTGGVEVIFHILQTSKMAIGWWPASKHPSFYVWDNDFVAPALAAGWAGREGCHNTTVAKRKTTAVP
jgi:hypothetical protein